MNAQAHRVVRRFLVAKRTQQTQKIEEAFDTIRKPLSQVESTLFDAIHRSRGRGGYLDDVAPDPVKQERGVRELAEASKHVLQAMQFSFSNPNIDATKHLKTRFKNLTKMIEGWSKALTWAELEPILMSQHTKSKSISEKYWDYTREFVSFVETRDTEHEGTLSVGPWTVSLFTSPRDDWNEEKIGKLRHILESTTKILSSMGFGAVSGGTVFAYPSKTLPGASRSHGAYASYSPSLDMMSLAVDGSVDHVTHALVHESGHRVYFKIMSGNARKEWENFFESESGPPNVDDIIKRWEAFANQKGNPEAEKYGRFTPYFGSELRKTDPDMFMWMGMILDKLPERDEVDRMTGAPKKGTKSGLDILIENRAKIKVFLHPVSIYSGTNPEELFAEIFAAWGTEGPGRVAEIVRDMFKRVLPQLKTARVREV